MGMTKAIWGLVAVLAAASQPAPVAAEFLPRPSQLEGPAPMLSELTEMLVGDVQRPERMDRLDAMLAQLPEPTPMRGFVEYVRAVNLAGRQRIPEAREAIEESIRLLPGYSGPLLFASHIENYADRPAPAADYLIRASEIDPQLVRRVPEYELDGIRRRLIAQGERRRLGRLAERMLAIGWEGSEIYLRSALALGAIESKIGNDDIAGARRLVSRLVAPQHLRTLLIENRYRPLWADVETWGGARQERQWPLYLNELRARFEAGGDAEDARNYVEVLRAANHHATIAREILPLFERLNRTEDYELLWAATSVADALARLGRWDEIETMFSRAAAIWPLGSDANALNVAGNRARFLLFAGRAGDSAAAFDAVIADATGRLGEVSAEALATMHLYRACALEAAGRRHEASDSVAHVLGFGRATLSAEMLLCFGRHEAARAALIEGLADESQRSAVLAEIQRSDTPPMQSEYGRLIATRRQALREDRILLGQAAQHGRVLPHSISAGAPPER
jgi:tetratricopeptide (TPR) repeat protein